MAKSSLKQGGKGQKGVSQQQQQQHQQRRLQQSQPIQPVQAVQSERGSIPPPRSQQQPQSQSIPPTSRDRAALESGDPSRQYSAQPPTHFHHQAPPFPHSTPGTEGPWGYQSYEYARPGNEVIASRGRGQAQRQDQNVSDPNLTSTLSTHVYQNHINQGRPTHLPQHYQPSFPFYNHHSTTNDLSQSRENYQTTPNIDPAWIDQYSSAGSSTSSAPPPPAQYNQGLTPYYDPYRSAPPANTTNPSNNALIPSSEAYDPSVPYPSVLMSYGRADSPHSGEDAQADVSPSSSILAFEPGSGDNQNVMEESHEVPPIGSRARRRAQNNIAQRAFRERSKAQAKEDRGHMSHLEEMTARQRVQLIKMGELVNSLQKENMQLRAVQSEYGIPDPTSIAPPNTTSTTDRGYTSSVTLADVAAGQLSPASYPSSSSASKGKEKAKSAGTGVMGRDMAESSEEAGETGP